MTPDAHRVKVWDLPVRLFHWLLVAAFALSWYSGEQGLEWVNIHVWSGYTIITLVGFRVLWGLAGSETARFSGFLQGPRAVLTYLRGWLRGEGHTLGHNPAGGWMVLVMLVLLLAQGLTGLFATDDIFFDGPLGGWVGSSTQSWLTGWHKTIFDMLLVLVALHIVAIVVYRLVRREDLVRPMITGYKREEARQPAMAPLVRAAVLLALVAGALALAVATAP
ncbi:MAG: cytochrome b/b6 domain-containing protein [Pseudomonadota bacterium]